MKAKNSAPAAINKIESTCQILKLKHSYTISIPIDKYFVSQVLHHLLSVVSIAYSMLSGEGQLYTYMVLISETTTPTINLRW